MDNTPYISLENLSKIIEQTNNSIENLKGDLSQLVVIVSEIDNKYDPPLKYSLEAVEHFLVNKRMSEYTLSDTIRGLLYALAVLKKDLEETKKQ